MNILGTQYTLNNKAFEIQVAGCNANPHCSGCHNPESWDFKSGEPYTADYASNLAEKITLFGSMIDNVWILGGEPLDQNPDDLIDLILTIKGTGKKIWLFTRYDFPYIPNLYMKYLDFIKTGAFNQVLKVDNYKVAGVTLATSNQKIYAKQEDGTWEKQQ